MTQRLTVLDRLRQLFTIKAPAEPAHIGDRQQLWDAVHASPPMTCEAYLAQAAGKR